MFLAFLIAVDAALQPFVKVDAKAVVLEHVRVIDWDRGGVQGRPDARDRGRQDRRAGAGERAEARP